MSQPNARPVFLDLRRIRLPAPAWTSLGHRLAGMLLVLALPWGLYLLQNSLRDAAGFAHARALLDAVWLQPVLFLVMWALAHHALAGARLLLLDIDVGHAWRVARYSAWAVNLLGVAVGLGFALMLFVS